MIPLENIAVQAAHAGGDVIIRSLNRVHMLKVKSKGRNDYVTDVDRFAEEKIISVIRKAYPGHRFIGEESGQSGGSDDEVEWIIDPIDGTTNFIHGFPMISVSIAARLRGRLEVGVIYDPLRQELFTASRGNGAMLDNRKIRVTSPSSLEGCLVGTGFPYRENVAHLDAYLGMLRSISLKAAGIRRGGSAALDLAYVAAGRLDGFWELGLKLWDIAAGEIIIREAGGLISDIDGNETHRETGNVVAGSPKVFREILRSVAPFANELA
ncbi:MAG: inositol monophosphatase [Gammaproteobacteria bacterium]|nr:inositol monophosphatase [Gammaproteobacteria bacterium]